MTSNDSIIRIEKFEPIIVELQPDNLDVDDEMTLAEVRSMTEAYEAKTKLVEKLNVCEAAMAANVFYKDAFEDCIKEFYNIIGHTSFATPDASLPSYSMTKFGPIRDKDGKGTAVTRAENRNLLTVNDYERVKKVLQYYKKYSALTNQSGFAEYIMMDDESVRRR